jgi:predicted phosphoadenosine phosphosulfate sulfurtransferase
MAIRSRPDSVRIYGESNVLDEARDRIRWVFDEFPNVIANVSGGKDSTVILHLALEVARERGRLPLRVAFIDQEAEWDATIEIIRAWMYHPDVEPYWYQMPIRLFNATSTTEHWLHCWDQERRADWVHDQDPISIKENVYGTDRFHELFAAIIRHDYPDTPTAYLNGLRVEESPVRFMGLTGTATYKWVTWGRVEDRRRHHYAFSPIYDWAYTDVWKAIHEHGWEYNRLYDVMHQYGIPIRKMRVSNVHHETAVQSLFFLQEVEPETYQRIVNRISGIDMAAKMGAGDYFVHDLPFMFDSWRDYRDYLLDHLIEDADWRDRFRKRFAAHDRRFPDAPGMYEAHVQSILTNDFEFEKLQHWEANLHGKVGQSRLEARRRMARAG